MKCPQCKVGTMEEGYFEDNEDIVSCDNLDCGWVIKYSELKKMRGSAKGGK